MMEKRINLTIRIGQEKKDALDYLRYKLKKSINSMVLEAVDKYIKEEFQERDEKK